MSAEEQVPKSRRRQVAKSTRKQGEKPVKVGLYLSLDAARRLGVTATMEGVDRSQIVDDLIRTHLRKYVVQVRTDRSAGDEPAGSDLALG
ncbi:MAG: hypothetical protein U0790_02080 [Isosphaeraceae bacterium]